MDQAFTMQCNLVMSVYKNPHKILCVIKKEGVEDEIWGVEDF